MTAREDPVRAVQAAYSAFARGNVAAVVEAFSENGVWDASEALWTKGIFFGHDGIRDYFDQLAGMWDDLRLDDYDIEPVRDGTLLVRGRLRGRRSGETVDAPFLHWVDLGPDGKIVRLRILVDPDR